MHVTSRILKTTGGRLPEAIPVVNHVIGILNEKHGSDFNAAIMVGGDPTVIGVTGMWESLGDFEKYRGSMMGDQELAGIMRMAAPLFADETQDTIWKIHMPPGERQAYTGVFAARVNMARLDEVAPFAAEAAGVVKSVTGNEIGIATAVTGDRSRLIWVGFAPDLAPWRPTMTRSRPTMITWPCSRRAQTSWCRAASSPTSGRRSRTEERPLGAQGSDPCGPGR